MMDKLTIISNDRFYNHENDYFCDHIAEKTLADELDNKFEVTLIGRKTNIQRSHKLKIKKIEHFSYIFPYLFAILKRISNGNSKFLIQAISPYTFLASLLFIFTKQKPIVYLRSDGFQEYKAILGFYGPYLYNFMFKIVSKIGTLISCRKHILRDKPGKVVSPSEITKNWSENITKPEFETVKLLYVGRMNVEKGIFSLLKILNNIDESINLTIIGESRQKKSKINDKNINISPIETKEEKLIKLYDDHNIFILPSFTEGHPMVLLEALSRMRPVIIFEEISHVIENKKGIFVSKRNSKDLLEVINYIKKNYDSIYEGMSQNQLPTKRQFINEFENLISS